MRSITIRRPDDMHVHFRQDDRMRAVVPFTAKHFGRAMVMPNTTPYITTVELAATYRDEIGWAVPNGVNFTPLMTLYLQKSLHPETIRSAKKSGFIHGVKFYPQGATTNSDGGLADLRDATDQLDVMQEVDLPLQMHGETANPHDDVFHREAIFYADQFAWLAEKYPKLRVVCEHITTKAAVDMIGVVPRHFRIAATITPQHMLVDRNYMLGSGLRPHAYCKPILKKEEDRKAILRAATSGDPRFFLGTDSAPHPQEGRKGKAKEADCGCAGCFTAHAALELYAEAFASVNSLHRLEGFASVFGARFYELPPNEGEVTLIEDAWMAEERYPFNDGFVVPFRQDQPLTWRIPED